LSIYQTSIYNRNSWLYYLIPSYTTPNGHRNDSDYLQSDSYMPQLYPLPRRTTIHRSRARDMSPCPHDQSPGATRHQLCMIRTDRHCIVQSLSSPPSDRVPVQQEGLCERAPVTCYVRVRYQLPVQIISDTLIIDITGITKFNYAGYIRPIDLFFPG